MIEMILKRNPDLKLRDKFGYKPIEILQRLLRDSKINEIKRKIKIILDLFKKHQNCGIQERYIKTITVGSGG